MKCAICQSAIYFSNIFDLSYNPICGSCLRKISIEPEVTYSTKYLLVDVNLWVPFSNKTFFSYYELLFTYYNPFFIVMTLLKRKIEFNILLDYNKEVIFNDEFTFVYNTNFI